MSFYDYKFEQKYYYSIPTQNEVNDKIKEFNEQMEEYKRFHKYNKVEELKNKPDSKWNRIKNRPPTEVNYKFIFLPGLLSTAAHRAHILSGTGLHVKPFFNDKKYINTARRLKRVFNRLDHYPEQVLESFKYPKPGVIIYSPDRISGNTRKYSPKWEPGDIQSMLNQGINIRIPESEPELPQFECYRIGKGWMSDFINDLPEWREELDSDNSVVPVFTTNLVFGIGSIRNTYGLENWYIALENAISLLITVDTVTKMGANNGPFNELRCIPVSNSFNAPNYQKWSPKMRQLDTTPYCLIIDKEGPETDFKLLDNFMRYKLYTIQHKTYHVFRLEFLHYHAEIILKTVKYVSPNRKQHVMHYGTLSNEDADEFFRIIFNGEEISDRESWSPAYLYEGMEWKLRYLRPTIGFQNVDAMLTGFSLEQSVGFTGNKRMAIYGTKGAMKTRFIRYAYTMLSPLEVEFVDTDMWGKFITKKWQDRKYVPKTLEEVANEPSMIELQAEKIFGKGRFNKNKIDEYREQFSDWYVRQINDKEIGIRAFQLWYETIRKSRMYVYMVHCSLEVRGILPVNPTPVLSVKYDTWEVACKRDKDSGTYIQRELKRFYDRNIPDLINYIDFKDILLLCGKDVTL